MRRALLIGINAYPHGDELKGCIEDVENLERVLSRNGDGTVNFDVRVMKDVQSSEEAMEAIDFLFHDDADCALFYFSGHGFVNSDGAEMVFPDDVRNKKGYYNGLQMATLMNVVNRSKAKNKIVILDCCYAGSIANSNIEATTSALNTGVSIMAACREDEFAEEEGGHGLFTELLCTALEGGAADFCGNITIGGIYAYIDRSFGAWRQRPVFKTNVTAFAPLKTVRPSVSMDVIRNLTTLFLDPNRELSLDPSFEPTNSPDVEHVCIEPYAVKDNVEKFELLQKLESIGFVKPVGEEHMYYAAMRSKTCRLTELGKYYWRLVNDCRI